MAALPGWLPEAREQRLAGLSKSTEEEITVDRYQTYVLLSRIMDHFKSINEKKGLTEEDRKQIKKFYLESFITPEARKLLQKHFPEHFPAENSAGAHRN